MTVYITDNNTKKLKKMKKEELLNGTNEICERSLDPDTFQKWTEVKAVLDKANKIGMYGEMPKIKIGTYTICMASDDENEGSVWIEDEDGCGEGASFKADLLEPVIKEFFDKNF